MPIDFEGVQERFRKDPTKTGKNNEDLAQAEVIAETLRGLNRGPILTWDGIFKEMRNVVRRKDVSPSLSTQSSVARAVRDFNKGPLTPGLITETFQTIWTVRGKKIGLKLVVPTCDRTLEELAELAEKDRRIGYLPEQLMKQSQRPLLGRIFSELKGVEDEASSNCMKKGNPVTNEEDRSGWFDYDACVRAPYRNTTEQSLRNLITAERRLGMNVNEYIVASEDSKLFSGQYLDIGKFSDQQSGATLTRLLGSWGGGSGIVGACFYSGRLYVSWTSVSEDRFPNLGGRSVYYRSL
ncbi:hypothetical protein M1437_04175 [Patescibacteria group bacterium]|nr:hypothetical protein [Patescibacteria group bacterium]